MRIDFRASASEGSFDPEHAVYIAWYTGGAGGYSFIPVTAAEKLMGDLTKAIVDARALAAAATETGTPKEGA
jgi:hypothetical protein